MTDTLTVLSHPKRLLTKVWKADSTIPAYDKAKMFNVTEAVVGGIHDLSELLSNLETKQRSCLIRGKSSGIAGATVRQKSVFSDQALHTILIEIDKYEPLCSDPVLDPVGAIEEYIECELPAEFRGVSYHWQLSSSAGHPTKIGLLKAHVWFWLEKARTSAALNAWAKAGGLQLDRSVFDSIQIHYTAKPVFEDGVLDPVPVRSGFVQELEDAVKLEIPEVAAREIVTGIDTGEHDDTARILEDRGLVIGVGSDGQLHIDCPFKSEHSMDSGISQTSYFKAGTDGHRHGNFVCQHTTCREKRKNDDFLEALGMRDEVIAAGFEAVTGEEGEVAVNKLEYDLSTNKDDKILATVENLYAILMQPELCGYHIRYDNFKADIVICRVGSEGEWVSLKDSDYTMLRIHLALTGFNPIGKDMIRDVVEKVAEMNSFDTAIEWLSHIKWDGVPRVSKFMSEYMGAEDTEYHTAVGEYMWCALAGRVMSPGCKADAAPVFVGAQDIGKSYAVMSMVPDMSFYTEIRFDDDEDNLARKMCGKLIAEFAELRGLHTKELEGIKAFITRQEEEWRPKYKERMTRFLRRLLFIGTSNKKEMFADETGNRRLFPTEVTRADIEAIIRDREQLWAEGREMFLKTGIYLYYREANKLLDTVQEEFQVTDVWEQEIENWLYEKDIDCTTKAVGANLTVNLVLSDCLGISPANYRDYDAKRVAKILRKLGFDRRRLRVSGERTYLWVKKNTPVLVKNSK